MYCHRHKLPRCLKKENNFPDFKVLFRRISNLTCDKWEEEVEVGRLQLLVAISKKAVPNYGINTLQSRRTSPCQHIIVESNRVWCMSHKLARITPARLSPIAASAISTLWLKKNSHFIIDSNFVKP